MRETESSQREILFCARRAANKLRGKYGTPGKRLRVSVELLDGKIRDAALREFLEKIERIGTDARHYWVGTFYTLLLNAPQRRSQAAYFTPPALARSVLTLLSGQGFDPHRHTVIDPAAGGAAFLSTFAAHMREAGVSSDEIVSRLTGLEIDAGLAQLSEVLIGRRLGVEIESGAVVSRADSLKIKTDHKYDVVVANPPYGRLSLSSLKGQAWEAVCHPGHINKYALFTELCLKLAKKDGLVALVLPSSFIGGPLYDRLRAHIRSKAEVLLLGSVVGRDDIFVDVSQDISILMARAGREHERSRTVSFGLCVGDGPLTPVTAAPLPVSSQAPWVAPARVMGRAIGGATLEDYGAVVRSGYFVWNREQHRMRTARRRKLDIPLIWAENISAGKFCFPKAKKRRGVDYVHFGSESSAIVRTNALVIQRTTNSSQSRRLVVARVSPEMIRKYGGFVSENHTIVVTAKQSRDLILLANLLNSAAVDSRYRELSGTASISVSLLRQLDLPQPWALKEAWARYDDVDAAIEWAYEQSMSSSAKAVA